jgi:3',5'-cyclic AMP phosphodiesterase CpdA
VRVAHITDLHVERRPTGGELLNKRFAGAVNLYLFGRHAHFTEASVRGVVDAVGELAPDLVLCTGDLTATATDAEFAAARQILTPLIDTFPFRAIPGNHDVYTSESLGRFAARFGDVGWGGRFPARESFGGLDVVALDVCVDSWLSNGAVTADALGALDERLAEGTAPALLLLHYPLRDRRGARYGPFTRNLWNAAGVEAVLARHPRVKAVLHGHAHHGYRTEIPLGDRRIPSYNPGAGGYAYLPGQRRTAHFNLYQVGDDGIEAVERFQWNGTRFEPEPGGAYATGG